MAIAPRTKATKQKGAKRWNPLNTCKSSILQGRGITWRKTQNDPIPQQRVLISYRPARKSDTSQTAFGLQVGKKEEQRNRFTTCGKGPSESLPLRMVCASLRVGLRRVGVQVPESRVRPTRPAHKGGAKPQIAGVRQARLTVNHKP